MNFFRNYHDSHRKIWTFPCKLKKNTGSYDFFRGVTMYQSYAFLSVTTIISITRLSHWRLGNLLYLTLFVFDLVLSFDKIRLFLDNEPKVERWKIDEHLFSLQHNFDSIFPKEQWFAYIEFRSNEALLRLYRLLLEWYSKASFEASTKFNMRKSLLFW